MTRPTIICLTPVKNEAWILDNFLKSASLWADHIIISDQMSTDGSREIAKKYPKVILIDNNQQKDFSEYGLRKPLIDEARKISGKRLLISLDADEIFTPNFESKEWIEMQNLPEGAIIKFPWINIYKNFEKFWDYSFSIPVGYMDDGAEFKSGLIHAARLFDPTKTTKVVYEASEIKILHLQYTDWERMKMKQRWYQCFEKINYPHKSSIDIFRQYHHMENLKNNDLKEVPDEWINIYHQNGIDINHLSVNQNYHWELTILNYFEEHGTKFFKELNIWDIDWVKKAKFYQIKNPERFKNPQNIIDKLIHKWLLKTQDKLDKRFFRRVDRVLKNIY